jgi:hypothetical protein
LVETEVERASAVGQENLIVTDASWAKAQVRKAVEKIADDPFKLGGGLVIAGGGVTAVIQSLIGAGGFQIAVGAALGGIGVIVAVLSYWCVRWIIRDDGGGALQQSVSKPPGELSGPQYVERVAFLEEKFNGNLLPKISVRAHNYARSLLFSVEVSHLTEAINFSGWSSSIRYQLHEEQDVAHGRSIEFPLLVERVTKDAASGYWWGAGPSEKSDNMVAIFPSIFRCRLIVVGDDRDKAKEQKLFFVLVKTKLNETKVAFKVVWGKALSNDW